MAILWVTFSFFISISVFILVLVDQTDKAIFSLWVTFPFLLGLLLLDYIDKGDIMGDFLFLLGLVLVNQIIMQYTQ